MMRKVAAFAILFCLLTASAPAKDVKPAHYLSPDAIDVTQLLADPPSKGSEEDQQELEEVLAVQQGRSAEQIARAQSEDKLTVFAFASVLGEGFSADKCPRIAALFADIDADSKLFTKPAKEHWARPRPPVVERKVKPVTKLEAEGSYPSGHSTRAIFFAEVLAQLFPDHRDALLERARQIGWDRVIAGVHYPSDVAAGRVLGHNLARVLLSNEAFKADLEKVRVESERMHPAAGAVSSRQIR